MKFSRLVWSTRQLLLVAAVSVASGLVLLPVLYAYLAASATGPFGHAALVGAFAVPPVLAMLVTRRPGACVLGALIGALVAAPFNPAGWVYPLVTAVYAVPAEAVFALAWYRRFGWDMVVLATPLALLLPNFALAWVPLGYGSLAGGVVIGIAAITLASQMAGCLIALLVARALERAGIIRHRDRSPTRSSPRGVELPTGGSPRPQQ